MKCQSLISTIREGKKISSRSVMVLLEKDNYGEFRKGNLKVSRAAVDEFLVQGNILDF